MTISTHILDRNLVNGFWTSPFGQELLVKSVELALMEDLGPNRNTDLTTAPIAAANAQSLYAVIYCKQPNVHIAGLALLGHIFNYLDPSVKTKLLVSDGAAVQQAPQAIATIQGKAAAVLAGERTVLNLLQRMSGIATLTSQYVERAKSHNIRILDTRKTSPGLRLFEKYAVALGGGTNHRFGLYDQLLVKDNHIRLAGSIAAVCQALKKAHPDLAIEVECTTLSEVEECLLLGIKKIMLDNMPPYMVGEAVTLINGASEIEVSGGINLANIDDYLLPGIDAISIGALTHSASNVDLSLEVERCV